MRLPPHGELIAWLRTRLGEPLPGLDAQLAMAPRVGDNLRQIRRPPEVCREAAVLVLLYPLEDGETGFVLTLRQKALQAHSGQVCLPGGSIDGAETPEQAAAREAYEEIGLDVDTLFVLGRLTRLFIPPSGFCVTPIVATVDEAPRFQRQVDEVAAIIEAPLSVLLDDERRITAVWHLQGRDVDVPLLKIAGHEVWGATAMMLNELAMVLRERVEGPSSAGPSA